MVFNSIYTQIYIYVYIWNKIWIHIIYIQDVCVYIYIHHKNIYYDSSNVRIQIIYNICYIIF